MRILFSGVPAYGHLLPLAPLMAAALDSGHAVALLTSQGAKDIVSAELPGAVEHLHAGSMPPVFSWETARRTGRNVCQPAPQTIGEIFGGTRLDTTVEEALECVLTWQPDMIVAEAFDTVGPLTASTLDVPWHQAALGPALPRAIGEAIDSVAAWRYAALSLSPRPASSYIDPCPPLLQEPDWASPATHRPVRPQAHRRPVETAPALDLPLPSAPRVLVTMGAIFSEPKILDAVVDAVRPLNVEVVVTKGFSICGPDRARRHGVARPDGVARRAADPSRANVHHVSSVPLEQLLSGVDVVIGAGGASTLLAALSHGLPMVLWPQCADQHINAARATAGGVAVRVQGPGEITGCLEAVLRDDSLRNAARRVASEIAAMPSPADVIAAVTGS